MRGLRFGLLLATVAIYVLLVTQSQRSATTKFWYLFRRKPNANKVATRSKPPRFSPIPLAEQAICFRFAEGRGSKGVTQFELAELLHISRNQIANVEAGRVPLKFRIGDAFCRALGLSQSWLATGQPPMTPYTFTDDPATYGPEPKRGALFSTVWLAGLAEHIATQRGKLDAMVRTFEGLRQVKHEDSQKLLTTVTESGNNEDVTLANLLGRLNRATAKRGMKSKLAKFMGVPLSNVSQWLSGQREPGGETTLRLLRWVQKQEGN